VPSGEEKNIILPMGNQKHISLLAETMDICLNLNESVLFVFLI
jgi:hypothetical protein